jgi:tetratricopeptide (TPR) repeat protein
MLKTMPLWALLLVPAAAAAAAPETPASYEQCMALVRQQPDAGFEAAVGWSAMGGGDAADHCAAYALTRLGQYAEAAYRFEALAQRMRAEPAARAAVLAQAAQAWLAAGIPDRAIAVLDAAIGLDRRSPELLVDRAEAHAARKGYAAALADLNQALGLNPDNIDALVFRASALRMLDDMAAARKDVERALALDPGHPEALLERGILKRLAKDDQGARVDWMRIVSESPESTAADNARRNLELLDVRYRR